MMAAARWSLVVGAAVAVAAVAVAVALSSPCFAATAAARPLPYAGRSSPTSLDCATVTSLLAGCKAFVRRGVVAASPSVPAPGAACCEGVAELYAVASDSADNWRSVCGCMAGLVRRYPSNASAIALLPVLCAVLPPAAGTLTYCTRWWQRARGSALRGQGPTASSIDELSELDLAGFSQPLGPGDGKDK
ncbi:hypothetical protein BDA96_02G135500 [Sorghum bicolor]|uniref:Bifunctional inhibitor/plant lipid transfer protein/seed storage helical domain-containing protein n=2 Tax=Sorghum bicolor TaxID=4558 RepID=A0A921RPG0_SORBI|nr:hypothetical protein BDA96_02G135500 [Sorghum bicolor]KXG35075.1 hypothetical protein SORBI_3002G129100 [Sorghum bicolor]